MPKGKPYINIGTEEASLFVHLSRRLINILDKNPFLYFSIEEALQSASQNHYAVGILTFSQIFNCFGVKAPEARHKVAYEFLQHKPTKETYDGLLETLKYVTEVVYIEEADKFEGNRDDFHNELFAIWEEYIKTHT